MGDGLPDCPHPFPLSQSDWEKGTSRGSRRYMRLKQFWLAGSARCLFIPLAVALLILIGYNVLINRTAQTSQRRQLLARLDRIPLSTDCLFLGNSIVEAGCDADTFKSAWPTNSVQPINLALGATSPVEHYLILKHALERPLHPKYLIYGFFDDQLNAPVHGDLPDLVGNRAFSYYFPDDAAALYSPGSWFKKYQMRILGHVPMFAERSSLWGKVELLRRRFEEIGMPKQKTNRYGRVEDFAALEAKDVPAFNQRCQAVVNGQQGFSPPLREIIRLAREHGANVILVEMPMPSKHRETFYASPRWLELRAYLQSLAKQERATYLAASDWVPDDQDFEDVTHLNEAGAKHFSVRLATAIAQIPARKTEVASEKARER